MKKIHVTQPFEVGSKSAKSRSLALVIPHDVVKQYGIGTSTVIIFRTNIAEKTITLQTIGEQTSEEQDQEGLMSVTYQESLAASKQHTSVGVR